MDLSPPSRQVHGVSTNQLGRSFTAIDPMLVLIGEDEVLQVDIHSEAPNWGRRRTCPVRGAKWGCSDPAQGVLCSHQ